jgi:predicted nuclease of restriction endonuclease-like (RecB) superfamily
MKKMNQYDALVNQIGDLLKHGKNEAAKAINSLLVKTYWQIGQYIVEFEQKGKAKADYGSELITNLSKDLTLLYGRGFSRSNLFTIRKFYLTFPKIQTPSGQFEANKELSLKLSWSHYTEILKADNDLEISFYIRQCEHENWSVRELKRQMNSMLFYRLAKSRDKEQVLRLSEKGAIIQSANDIIRDPFVFEFLDLPQKERYLEGEIEEKLIQNLEQFLLELGKGFTFVGRQYKISIGGRHFYVDLVFYHRILKCFVLFDLKRGEIEHNDIGQMNLYLNYFTKEENVEDDNPPIGIILGAYKDHILVEYATQNITNQLFVSKYQLYLPDKKQLQSELEKLLDLKN